ncbi:MAG: YegP family protein [Gammaproteobacteria bacterium]|nr:YegP family protein [Gammaproteobacteria bacterium]
MSGKFEIFVGKDEQFYFHLKAGNGEIILASEGYTQKHNAEKAIESVRVNSQFDDNYVDEVARDGSFYFVLRADNHEVIGVSQMYQSRQGADHGKASVKANGLLSDVVDLS